MSLWPGVMAETTNFEYPAAIAKHFGTWEGKSVHFSPEGEVLESYNTKIEVGARGKKYSQRNTYTWPDGRKVVKEFPGEFDSNGKHTLWTSTMRGEGTVINDEVIVYIYGPAAGDEAISDHTGTIRGTEIITVCPDKKTRNRTNQLHKDGKPWKTTNIIEQLVSKDVFFEGKA